MTTIRPATSDDAPAIAHVQVETWRSAYRGIVADDFLASLSEETRTRRWREIMQQPQQAMFVAEDEGNGVFGFANGGPERNGREDFRGELCGLYVLPEWHGKGNGRRLVTIPLSRFSGQTIERLRRFHVLNGHEIRSYAAKFIRE